MKALLGLALFGSIFTPSLVLAQEQSLQIIFPPTNYQTSLDKLFFLGTAPPTGQVFINGKAIDRSKAGHFAPNFPLQLGDNLFTVRYQNQEIQIKVTRVATHSEVSQGNPFAADSLSPSVDIARLPGELICFSAIARANASVAVKLADQNIPLLPQPYQAELPSNLAVLTGNNQPAVQSAVNNYQGCTTLQTSGNFGQPQFQLTLDGKTITQMATGKISILSPSQLQVAQVKADAGVARTGPSTDNSRLTPLPKGTRAAITGREGEWLRLDYGAWINSKETQIIPGSIPPQSIIRSVSYHLLPNAVEMTFPLETPVPVSVQQGDRTFTLTLYNTTAQTDIIPLGDNPLISRLDWQQVAPGQVQYTFNLKKQQQWGYKLRYAGTSLILSLRQPPQAKIAGDKPLSGIKILLDPGHGGKEPGASGPTGYLEKDLNLSLSKLVRDELVKRGATVIMTRDDDHFVALGDRVAMIDQDEPTISISIHHNSLPDNGDAQKIQGFSAYWYNTQAHSLAIFLDNYIVKKLGRSDYGVFWDNLALTRSTTAPCVLLEVGFMSNPREFEVITNPKEQKKEAKAIAQGIVEWFKKVGD